MFDRSTDRFAFLLQTSSPLFVWRFRVGMFDLEQLFHPERWVAAVFGHVGGWCAGSTTVQLERADPKGVAGEAWVSAQALKKPV